MATDTPTETRRSSIFGKIANAFKGPDSEKPRRASTQNDKPTTKATEAAPKTLETVAASTNPAGNVNPPNEALKKPYDVKGKTAIITGAGSGINHRFAKLLLSKGCNVLIADLALRPEAEALLEEYSGKDDSKPKCVFAKTDVTNWTELSNMFRECYESLGAVDIVCPGAGVFEPHWSNFWLPPGSSKSKDPVDSGHYKILDINITHPIRTAQLAIAEFLKPSKGEKVSVENPKHLVFVSSIAGQVFGVPYPLYIASKHAMNGFIRCVGGLDHIGIKSTGVAPGIVKTPLWTEDPEKMKFTDAGPQEWVTPEEVAEAMLKGVEDGEIPSGNILEVGLGYTRSVQPFNDPGPVGRPGISVNKAEVSYNEVFEWLGEDGWGKQGL